MCSMCPAVLVELDAVGQTPRALVALLAAPAAARPGKLAQRASFTLPLAVLSRCCNRLCLGPAGRGQGAVAGHPTHRDPTSVGRWATFLLPGVAQAHAGRGPPSSRLEKGQCRQRGHRTPECGRCSAGGGAVPHAGCHGLMPYHRCEVGAARRLEVVLAQGWVHPGLVLPRALMLTGRPVAATNFHPAPLLLLLLLLPPYCCCCCCSPAAAVAAAPAAAALGFSLGKAPAAPGPLPHAPAAAAAAAAPSCSGEDPHGVCGRPGRRGGRRGRGQPWL